ncbi:MAG: S8 family serine peptidase [Pseudomonadota bacterium]
MATKKSTTRSKARRQTSSTRSSPVEAKIATTSAEHRPSHLVLFRRPSEANLTLCERMGLKASNGVSSIRAGVSLMSHGRSGEAPSRMYSNLGLMVTDLDDNEADVYSNADEVEMVVRNELRSLPDPTVEIEETPAGNDTLIAYLHGMHDATAAALRFAGESSVGDAVMLSSVSALPPAALSNYPLGLIGMHEGYSRFTGANVTVAVLDTGIDLQHADFAGRVSANSNAVSFVPNESVQDGHGHGTHCAGTVAGPMQSAANRRYGVAPDVNILIGKVLSNAGRGHDDQIIDGIDWAATSGARVISLSLGSRRAAGEPASVLYERIASRLLASDNGALLIAAAGNGSARPHFIAPVENPAAARSIMAVAAVDRQGRVWNSSSAQRDAIGEVNVAAPGVLVFSSWAGGGYQSISGTSMATPHVAGVAALMLEQDPSLTPQALWQRLEQSASTAGEQTDVGYGIVQAP